MAASSSEQLIEHSKEETSLPAENKELIITMTTEGPGPMLGSDVRAEVPSSNGTANSPLPAKALEEEEEDEEATPTPPESSSLSSENGTVTVATTEEESLSVLLRHIRTDRGPDRGGEPGKGSDQVQVQLLAPERQNSQNQAVMK